MIFCLLLIAVKALPQTYAVELCDIYGNPLPPSSADIIAESLKFVHLGQVGALPGHYLFAPKENFPTTRLLRKRSINEIETQLSKVAVWWEKQVPKKRVRRSIDIKDPLYASQWYIKSSDGIDLNVMPLWDRGINGTNVKISIIDDGVEFTHEDLAGNYMPALSYDYNRNSEEPLPQEEEDIHGTRCAGEIASLKNSQCGIGVAFGSKFAALRLISSPPTDSQEASAMNHGYQSIDIYSSSWGPEDNGASVDKPGRLTQKALENGVTNGRYGRGSIFVTASGNGGYYRDNCNFDGYANSIYTIAIGAIDYRGIKPVYGEECAAQLVVAYGGTQTKGLATTDRNNACTLQFYGTSAAAPLVSGVVALMLSARHELGWRDVQHLLIHAAVVTDEEDEGWRTNGAGLKVSHKYGFGRVDANKLVDAAISHSILPPAILRTFYSQEGKNIVAGKTTVLRLNVTSEMQLEHVTFDVKLTHPTRGKLQITLKSPHGTPSILASERPHDDGSNLDWRFMSVHHWGEESKGEWTLEIRDLRKEGSDGWIRFFAISIHGTCNGECPETEEPSAENMTNIFWLGFAFVAVLLLFAYFNRRSKQIKVKIQRSLEEEEGLLSPSVAIPMSTLEAVKKEYDQELNKQFTPTTPTPMKKTASVDSLRTVPLREATTPKRPIIKESHSTSSLSRSASLEYLSIRNKKSSPNLAESNMKRSSSTQQLK